MKAPRLTLSIVLLLSLPAKMKAADQFTAETPASDSIISYRHGLLASATDSVLTHRNALTAIVGLQNPKMHNSERERDLLASGKYSWQPVKDGERTRYILQGDGVYTFDEEQPVSEAPVAIAESSSGWMTSLLPRLFTRASTSEEPVKSESVPTFKDILQKLDPELVDKKNDVVQAISQIHLRKDAMATVPFNEDSRADWKVSRAMRLEEGVKAKSVLAPRHARVDAYYGDAAVTKQMLVNGMVSQELALFNKTTEQRALARQGNSPADQQQLLNLVESRRIRMEGGRTQQPGLKLLSALGAKTAEQRTQVLVQLRATESALTNALNAARKQAYTALNQSPNYELIFNLAALTNAIQDTTATEGASANSILQQFTQKSQGTSLTFLPLAAFADGLISVYNSWNTSFGEPAQATELRSITQAIPTIEAALADAKEKKIGHLIDRHTLALAQHKAHQEALFTQLQNQVAEATRAVLLTDEALLNACTRIGQLQTPLANIKAVIADESNPDLKPLASMLALLTADSREEGRVTFDAIRGLLGSSASRADLKRQKAGAKERTAFKVRSHDPDYYFVRDTLAPAVDTAAAELAKALAEELEAANKPTFAEIAAKAATSSSTDTQQKQQHKKQTGKGKGPARKPKKRNL